MKMVTDLISNCRVMSWIVGGLFGVLALVLLMVQFDANWLLFLFLAVLIGAGAAFILSELLCEVQKTDESTTEPVAAIAEQTQNDSATANSTDKAVEDEGVAATAEAVSNSDDNEDTSTTKSTLLEGEKELAARKGNWSYVSNNSDAILDNNGDSVKDETTEGVKPSTLSGARENRADDLKDIKGVGRVMEEMLNKMGFYHFDQIAAWSADEIAWVDANLEGFHGRVSRDNWVAQAKTLESGVN